MAVPSIQAHICHPCQVWLVARAARAADRNRCLADRHCIPAPDYKMGQQVWLSSRDVPLQTDSQKLSPRFINLYPNDCVINPSVSQLKLPAAL